MIRARTYPDNHALDIHFDATPYFEQASNEELVSLIECDFGGNTAADSVALYFQNTNEDIKNMFAFLEALDKVSRDSIGFEVHVDESDAIAWLKANRPTVLASLDLADYNLVQCEQCDSIGDRVTMSKATKKNALHCNTCVAT